MSETKPPAATANASTSPTECRSPLGTFEHCPQCEGPMAAEHAHFRCARCGWRDSCCD